MGDGGRVAVPGVTAATETGLLRRRRQRPQRSQAARGGGEPEHVDPLPTIQADLRQMIAERERGEDVALDVEVSLDVGAGEAELARRGQESLEGGRRAHHQRGIGVGPSHAGAVVRLDRDR
jgi:hypothetical protein